MIYRLTLLITLISNTIFSQEFVSGTIKSSDTKLPIKNVKIYEKDDGLIATSNKKGEYKFFINKNRLQISFFSYNYSILDTIIFVNKNTDINIYLNKISVTLSPVEIKNRDSIRFTLTHLRDVEETSIYSGKKTEVILIDEYISNSSNNNARQIYNKVSGLNIYQNDDAGLQLNIGGRGLDPKRTANFNTRQNGYDISADVLGYPESYYTPPVESLEKIKIIRGASSLQYGTQFGGLINFIIKEPVPNKRLKLICRNTTGSNSLYTNFTSISSHIKNFKSYSFFNYKKGDGFRSNSNFESYNFYSHLGYHINKINITTEITYLNYLAKQAGGLTDIMFNENMFQSNRERNWFHVNWFLFNSKLYYDINNNNKLSLSIFGLDASRDALGFRSNRVSQIDPNTERDLIKGKFNNFGLEIKYLHRLKIFNKDAVLLIGSKIYNSYNISKQGPGSENDDPDFNFYYNNYPYYINQSSYKYPNINQAIFIENIYYINDKLSITPGLRFEYINTEAIGNYRQINLDGANNVIFDTLINEDINRKRSFILTGIGTSYKLTNNNELYANASQNYRSVTFSDISIINPSYVINKDISDEHGYTIDIGIRGNNNYLSYDLTSFILKYNDRIGFIQKVFSDGNIKSERNNIGNAVIYGLETLIDLNLCQLLNKKHSKLNYYINTSIVDSRYLHSLENGVTGKKVEFVPNLNLKTGLRVGYKYITSQLQYTFLSEQFTDASNAIETNLSGIIGVIPQYSILDFSSAFLYKDIRCEFGINNLLNSHYFTRRATGYPGPGIIPSPNRNFYVTLQFSL